MITPAEGSNYCIKGKQWFSYYFPSLKLHISVKKIYSVKIQSKIWDEYITALIYMQKIHLTLLTNSSDKEQIIPVYICKYAAKNIDKRST